jgi:hypothetical protein
VHGDIVYFDIVHCFDCLCRVTAHCIKKRLLWNTCFACKVCKEGEYYEDMMRYLRKNLAVRVDGLLFKRSFCFDCILVESY